MAARRKKEERGEEDEKPKKVKGPTAPSRDERIATVLEFVQKKMKGRAQLKPANEYYLPYLTKRLPTGLLSLDAELRGGFPCGGLSQIIGPKNSGKSWLAWQVIRQLQHLLGNKMRVLLAMTEMRADRSQARRAGVVISLGDADIEAADRARQNSGWPAFTKEQKAELRREIGTIHELHGMSAEDLYDGILVGVENNAYHVIIIDSFGNIMSKAEEESDSLSEKTYAGTSAVNAKFLRKLGGLLSIDDEYGITRDPCIIGINHIRDAIGDPNKEYKAPGGKALEHAKFVDLYISSGKTIGNDVSGLGPDMRAKQIFMKTGKEVNWRIEKGKAGIHEGGRGAYNYIFDLGQADFYADTFVAGAMNGVIQMSGTWCCLPNLEDQLKPLIYVQGRDNFVQILKQDAEAKYQAGDSENAFMNIIRDRVFRARNIDIQYDWED